MVYEVGVDGCGEDVVYGLVDVGDVFYGVVGGVVYVGYCVLFV